MDCPRPPSRWRSPLTFAGKTPATLALRGALLFTLFLLLSLWAGCDSAKHYKTLSFFFDGVPDPNARKGTSLSGTGAQAGPVISYAHKPYSDGNCTACHVGGVNSVFEGTTQLEVDPHVCLKCHQKVLAEYPILHGPVANVQCLRCHAPHESMSPNLLAGPSPNICVQCHDSALLLAPPKEHEDPKANCLSCHSGHGGLKHGLLKLTATTRPLDATTRPAEPPPQPLKPVPGKTDANNMTASATGHAEQRTEAGGTELAGEWRR